MSSREQVSALTRTTPILRQLNSHSLRIHTAPEHRRLIATVVLDTSVLGKIDNDTVFINRRVKASTTGLDCEGNVIAYGPVNLSRQKSEPFQTLNFKDCTYSFSTLIFCLRQ